MENNTENIGGLASRIEKLERSNKLLKASLGVVGCGVAAVLLMGAAPSKRTVEGERFVFKDGAGKERLVLDTTPAGPTCTLNDINGKASFKVVINKDGFFQMPSDPQQTPPAVQKRPAK